MKRIKYNIDAQLSVQHLLDCSYYNQGCDGGSPFLVGKFAHDLHLIETACKEYNGETNQNYCDDKKYKLDCYKEQIKNIFKVKDYNFIGGSYGKSNMRNMMKEIKKNGPIVVRKAILKVSMPLMYYKDGIYKHIEDNEWILKEQLRPEWTEVNLNVLCYGWGEENGIKFWYLQNSWGDDWGQNGNFKMLRGDDSGGIESAAQAAIPYMINIDKDKLEKDIFMNMYL